MCVVVDILIYVCCVLCVCVCVCVFVCHKHVFLMDSVIPIV